jgi:two-component system, cell cycle sensor histidine kinase and response regulator CckA
MPDTSRGTVLLVEGEQNVRVLVRDQLKERGYTVLDAAEDRAALKECRTHQGPIHLIIANVLPTGPEGADFLRRAKSLRPDMKTLLLSVHSEGSMVYRGFPLTELNFLPKPFSLKTLLTRVDELVGAAQSPPAPAAEA